MAASGRDLQMRELMDTMKELKLTIEALRKELTTKDKLIENLQELSIPPYQCTKTGQIEH